MELISLIIVGISLLITGFNTAIFCVIKFNDLHHLAKAVEEIKESIKEIGKKLDNNAERVSNIEGTCKANHR